MAALFETELARAMAGAELARRRPRPRAIIRKTVRILHIATVVRRLATKAVCVLRKEVLECVVSGYLDRVSIVSDFQTTKLAPRREQEE